MTGADSIDAAAVAVGVADNSLLAIGSDHSLGKNLHAATSVGHAKAVSQLVLTPN